jgi:predicted alpha-1,2-mannosidase
MVRLGPDTESWFNDMRVLNRSGYHYGDNKIIGFSHNRLTGADAAEGGAFRVFPALAEDIEAARRPDRAVKFSHARERAFPGYYGVQLDNGVVAEMTATTRAGIHRYRYAEGSMPVLLLDVGSALGKGRCENMQSRYEPESGELSGSMRTFGTFSRRYGGLDVYFAAQVSPEPIAHEFRDGLIELRFSAQSEVELRLALSYVSVENARANLDAETGGKTFEDILDAAGKRWEEVFGRINVEGGTEREQRIFYTALMRAFTMPTTFSDVNGQYTGFDGQVHVADGFTYYTDFSIWDTFRTVHPLFTLIAPREHTGMLRSLTEMVKQGGALPRWPSGAGYTNCMFGTPADILVSEAYLKGLRDFDAETVYQAARATALAGVPASSRFGGRQGLEAYLKYGYCPSDLVRESVACTIDYAWCDGALASWAQALGKTEDAALLSAHAESYKQVWNPATRFFQGRDAAGNFDPNLRPLKLTYMDPKHAYTGAYVEGSAMQCRWGTLFHAEGLVSLWPSREEFVSELTRYLDGSQTRLGWWNPGGNYWHGNEPFIHAAYLFNAAGRPDLTQRYVRHLLDTKYSDGYAGLDGNDDGGTLSAWYVFSSMGFYPVAGSTRYEVGSPLFTQAEIDLGNGQRLTMRAPGGNSTTVYVSEVAIHGAPIRDTHFDHADIVNGGELRFTMTDQAPRAEMQ